MDFDEMGYLGKQINIIQEEIYEEHKDIFQLCYDINKETQKVKFLFDIKMGNVQHIIVPCLFTKILNGFQSVVLLYRYGLSVEAKCITRTILESLFVLKAICQDEKLVQEFINVDNKRREKLGNAIFDKKNEDIFDIVKQNLTFQMIEELRENNKREGIKDISAQLWSEKSSLETYYQYAYRILSDDIHTNPRSLEKYLHVGENNEEISIDCTPNSRNIKPTLYTASSVMIIALENMCNLFNVKELIDFEGFEDRLVKLTTDCA